MKLYQLSYYNSGGYKASLVINTAHTINRDQNNDLQVLDAEGNKIGDVEFIEQLLSDAQGWVEENTVFEVESVDTR